MAVRDEIAALYQSILGRPADEAGLNYFTNAVTSGAGTLSDVARDMRSSAEAQGLLGDRVAPPVGAVPPTPVAPTTGLLGGATTNTAAKTGYTMDAARNLVSGFYKTGLFRQAEPGGLDFWSNAIVSGQMSPDEVYKAILASPEKMDSGSRVKSELSNLYKTGLFRDADVGGLDFWTNAVLSGDMTLDEAKRAIMASPEGRGAQIGVRPVPFGSQAVGGNVYEMARYNAPQNMPPSIQNAFQQSLQYQASLPYMIPQFNPADIPGTYQQIAGPRQRLDISNLQLPQWLIDAAKKDEARMDRVGEGEATETTTKERTSSVTPVVNPPVVNPPVVNPPVVTNPATTPAIAPWIVNTYANALGRAPEAAGAAYWQAQSDAGVPIADLIATIQSSPEAMAYKGGGLLGK